ncbi:MAG: RNA polymerase sigma factor RpoH [Candidatus Paracaedibacteraceae bacterium]|nr:RNA polymerase sigma factor RpoH [Candidatus Paracaedibacteraceae bacterium]
MSFFRDNDHDSQYIRKVKEIPMLSNEEEVTLARAWRDTMDRPSAEKLINAHLRLVAKVAAGYRGYGLPLSDLIAEGNIGMLQAMKHYDPEKGFRLSTYAVWWIRASIQEHILHNWSLIKIGTTSSQKKLFFKLRATSAAIRKIHQEESLTPEVVAAIAKKLNVREDEVIHMSQRLTKDHSLNTTMGNDSENPTEWIEWLVDERDNQEIALMQRDEMSKRRELFKKAMECLNDRERVVIQKRRLFEPPKTLEEVAGQLNISRERVRQIENVSFAKLQKHIRMLLTPHPHNV